MIPYNADSDSKDRFFYTNQLGGISYEEFTTKLIKEMGSQELNLVHMAIGIAGEAGELLDAIKKHWAYNKPLDVENVLEELGDLEFYMAGMRQLIGVSRNAILDRNVSKLSERYKGLQYSDEAAITRADKIDQGIKP